VAAAAAFVCSCPRRGIRKRLPAPWHPKAEAAAAALQTKAPISFAIFKKLITNGRPSRHDQAHFIRDFKKLVGKTPTEYVSG
jgi:hypothetical protein